MPALPRLHSGWLFPVLVVALLLVEYQIVQSVAFTTHTDLLALVITIDIVVGIPVLGYLFLVRPRRAPATILALLLLVGVLLAHFILPDSGKRYLNWIQLAVPIAEIALFLYGLSKIRHLIQQYHAIRPTAIYTTDALEQSLHAVIGKSPVVSIFLTEAALLYYAVGGWFTRYHPPASVRHVFTYHLKSGYGMVAAMMMGLSLIELPLVHLVVHHFNPIVAWVLSFLSAYGLLWMIGDYQAIRLHPIVIDENHLHLRAGMRWRVSLPLADIQTVRTLQQRELKNKAILDLSVAGSPKLLLELRDPVRVRGLFGMKRVTRQLALAVDEEQAFIAALKE